MMKERIYIDMDNTLCDYKSKYQQIQRDEPKLDYPQSKAGFYLDLNPLPGAIDAFRILEQHYEVYILTAPSYMNPRCYTEKRIWVEHYFDIETTKNLILCRRKGLLKGNYLIDDHPYPEFEGKQLVFGSSDYKNWSDVLRYFNL